MHTAILVPFVVSMILWILGCLIYFAEEAKKSNIGLQMFWVGILMALYFLPPVIQ